MAVLELSVQAEAEHRDRPVHRPGYGEGLSMVRAVDGDTLGPIGAKGIVPVVATGRLEVTQM